MTDISFNGIRAFVFDVDGILTNGGIFADNEGNLFRTFDAKDAFGKIGRASCRERVFITV